MKAPAAPQGGGYGATKKPKGRKRHVAVDADGWLLLVDLATADAQDAVGAVVIIAAIRKRRPWLRYLFADGTHDRGKLTSEAAYRDFVGEVVRKFAGQQGFRPQPRRWIVEWTPGWVMRRRRLVRDHEHRCDGSQAMMHAGMGALLLRRTADP